MKEFPVNWLIWLVGMKKLIDMMDYMDQRVKKYIKTNVAFFLLMGLHCMPCNRFTTRILLLLVHVTYTARRIRQVAACHSVR